MFEWQWQHPKSSRILKDRIVGIKYQGKGGKGQLLLLQVLLHSSLWAQLDLCVHFLNNDNRDWFRALPAPAVTQAAHSARIRSDVVDPAEVGSMSERESPTKTAMSIARSFASSSAGADTPPPDDHMHDIGSGVGAAMEYRVACGMCVPNSGNTTRASINSSINSSSASARTMIPIGFEKQLWSCPNCGAVAHILCSAAAAVLLARTCALVDGRDASNGSGGLDAILPAHFKCYACAHQVSRIVAARMSFNPSRLTLGEKSSSGGRANSMFCDAAACGDSMGGGGAGGAGGDEDEYREEDERDRDEDIQEEGEEDEDGGFEDYGSETGCMEDGNISNSDSDSNSNSNALSARQRQRAMDLDSLYEHRYAADAGSVLWTSTIQRSRNAENVVNIFP